MLVTIIHYVLTVDNSDANVPLDQNENPISVNQSRHNIQLLDDNNFVHFLKNILLHCRLSFFVLDFLDSVFVMVTKLKSFTYTVID